MAATREAGADLSERDNIEYVVSAACAIAHGALSGSADSFETARPDPRIRKSSWGRWKRIISATT